MDRKKDVRKQIEDIRLRLEKSRGNVTWDELRQVSRQMTKNLVSDFDEAINSFWTRGKSKGYLQIFKALVQMHGNLSEEVLNLSEYVHDITKSVLLLSGKLEKSDKITTDLEDSLTKLESKLKEPAIERMVKFLDMIDAQIAKGNKAREEYTV